MSSTRMQKSLRFSSTSSSVRMGSGIWTMSRAETEFRAASSPMTTISWIASGARESDLSAAFWPRSIRRAISTSPSRVSSGTVPISRRYMRTGSLIFSPTTAGRSRSAISFRSAFDTARDFDLALARQQRDRAHLPQVHAHRVVDLLAYDGGQVQIDKLFALIELFLEILGLFQDFDAGRVQAGQHVFEFGASRQISGQYFAHLVVQDVALLPAHLYETVQPFEFVL